eukprot:TRINITY_DN847_c0_g1_i1.p1 TRINITY_DN847_c0_g1~~TRINITY_DN847_c0_g1_i1.p1  ORF type:complete len:463 (+),score=102.73 TRINITY_DN847_c0_g1_i1:44-1432(+)
MLKPVVAALGFAAFIGADAQRKPVCVPPVHSFFRLAWHSQNDEFDRTRVYNNYQTQQFRFTDGIEQADGDRDEFSFLDSIYLPRKGLHYQITGPSWRDNSTWKCQTTSVPNEPIQDPCFTPNGTQAPTNRIGSNTLVDNFYWTRQDNGRAAVNSHIQITPAGVPVDLSHWNAMGHEVETFLDVNTTLPTDAFDVPSICPPPSPQTRRLSAAQAREHPVIGRHFEPFAPTTRRAAHKRAAPVVQGSQQSICVPPVNVLNRRAWHAERNTYARTVEYLDVPHQKARFTDRIFFENSPTDQEVEYMDLILDGPNSKIYRITQRGNDSSTRNCTVNQGIVSIKNPCFTTNGTHQRSATIAGDLVVDIFFANNTDRSGIEHYAVILITQQGVPVQIHHNTPAHGFPQNPVPSDHWVELFEDFNTTLPGNAFAIPSICTGVASTPLDLPKLKTQHTGLMSRVLSVVNF